VVVVLVSEIILMFLNRNVFQELLNVFISGNTSVPISAKILKLFGCAVDLLLGRSDGYWSTVCSAIASTDDQMILGISHQLSTPLDKSKVWGFFDSEYSKKLNVLGSDGYARVYCDEVLQKLPVEEYSATVLNAARQVLRDSEDWRALVNTKRDAPKIAR
jgi:hypothetical protein